MICASDIVSAVFDVRDLQARIRVVTRWRNVEAGSEWVWDPAAGAHVDASGADRVLLPGMVRVMVAGGYAHGV